MQRMPIAKLTPPHVGLISHRSRVREALARGLRSGMCWIAAPAGYGKTTAVAEYLESAGAPFLWYRVDEGDRDIAGFFHYLTTSLPVQPPSRLPIFGPEYADQPEAFARRFFREYFSLCEDGCLLILDDLHSADRPQFNATLNVLRAELPPTMGCVCVSRNLPPRDLENLSRRGRLDIIDQDTLRFTDEEASALIALRSGQPTSGSDSRIACARGWAVGLTLLANRDENTRDADIRAIASASQGGTQAVNELLEREWFDTLPDIEAAALLRLGLLSKITPDIALALVGEEAPALLLRLQARQMLVSRGAVTDGIFHLHDLLRDFLRERLQRTVPAQQRHALQREAAELSWASGRHEDAIELALQAPDAPLAARMIVECAPTLIEQGRRQTLMGWCSCLPEDVHTPWLCYWLGVAHIAEDARAEYWLERAWHGFVRSQEPRGQCLAVAHAVLSKTDSWRTHTGLPAWTRRAIALAANPVPALTDGEELLVLAGFVRAFHYAEDYRSGDEEALHVASRLLARLASPEERDPPALRLLASAALIVQAGSTADAHVFECAVDSVADIVARPQMAQWPLGMWLVAFGAASGRYFRYSRRDFAFADAESALREAMAIGLREELRGVEFGALYHLQLQMKLRNDFAEWPALVERLSSIADSRNTTQVAVVADCRAAMRVRHGDLVAAGQECERFNRAIEAANEPPIERWPHYITEFQVLLAADQPAKAAALLESHVDVFDGSVLMRTQACIAIARALLARNAGDGRAYAAGMQDAFDRMRRVDWYDALINLPEELATICADAIEAGIEPEFCGDLIRRRRLAPPASRPPHWPWPLKIRVLGEFALELHGKPLMLGPKAPARSLDILRALAIEKNHVCSLDALYDRFWPDSDGDRAKASCEQALHRLRKLLGPIDCVTQREGRLRLATENVWVDLDHWESRLGRALAMCRPGFVPETDTERTLFEFPGGLLMHDPPASWWLPVAERMRSKVVDLALRLGAYHERHGRPSSARSIYLRGLDLHPDTPRLYEVLIRLGMATGDRAGALDDLARFERAVPPGNRGEASALLRRLVGID